MKICARPGFAVAFISLLSMSIAANSQVVGASLHGTVTDTSNAALSGATVVVRNLDTGFTRTTATAGDGHYTVPSVPVGRYTVTVRRNGFAPQEESGITLVVGQNLDIDFSLGVEAVRQQVVVSAAPSVVNLSTQQTSGVIDEHQIKQLPLNGRSYDQLLTLNPATVNYTAERSGSTGTSNSSVGNMFSIAGHRPQDNLFLLNGIEYTGASLINVTPGGASGQLLGVDAVREFNVLSDDYGANYGKRSGAQISIVTMSGTNQLHGNVYEFLRNSALDARNYFDIGSIPEFQRNQFGASLGGPLRPSHLFLFGDYEGYRQNLALSDVTLVPDKASRAAAVPSVQPLLALWPEPNGPELGQGVATAYSHPQQRIREDFGTTRFDDNIGDKDLLFAAYTVDDSTATTPSANPLSLVDESLREQVASLQEQHIFSASLLNTARIGFSRASYFFTGSSPVRLPGWVSGRPIGAIVISGSTASNGASQITLAGTNVGSNNTTARNLFTYADHVYWSHGRHQVEAGAWLQQTQSNDNLAQNQNGQASFSTLAAFLQGKVRTFTVVPSPTPLNWRSLESAAFVQDVFKAAPRLEVRAGIRFEGTNGWNEAHHRASNYLLVNGALQTDPRIGGSALTKNRAVLLPEPRVGFAWDVTGRGTTAVRAGFGLYHGLLDTLDYRLDQAAPFNTTISIANTTVADLRITAGSAPPSGSLVSPSSVQTDIATPTTLSWTLAVEQALGADTALTLRGVGSHSYHQILSEDENEPVPTFLPNGTACYPPGAVNINPQLANSTSWVSQGVGLYNALEVQVRHNLAHALEFRGNYTFSKNLDDGSAWNTSVSGNTPAYVSFPLRPKWDWGAAATDVRNIASINATWELPAGPGHSLLGNPSPAFRAASAGWSLSAIIGAQSGFPFSPQLGYNPTGNGDTRNPVRPSWNPAFHSNLYSRTTLQYFNPNAFLPPATGTYGDVSRDALTGPGLSEVDFSALKNTQLARSLRLQFRAEFFNLLNHSTFLTPNPVIFTSATSGISPTAAVITATSTTSRQIQFGARLVF